MPYEEVKSKRIIGPALSLICIFSLLSAVSYADEYSLVPSSTSKDSLNRYFNTQGLPRIQINSNPLCINTQCKHALVDDRGTTLLEYPANETLSIDLQTRYRDRTVALITHSWIVDKKTYHESFFIDNNNVRVDRGNVGLYNNYLDRLISPQSRLISVDAGGIADNGVRTVASPIQFESAIIKNNPEGDISALAMGEDGQLYFSDLKTWQALDIWVSEESDRNKVLSYYPVTSTNGVAAYYEYTNSYNKGIRLISIKDKNKSSSGWLFNSDERNVGFDPQVYVDKNQIIVIADDSTHRERVKFSINEAVVDKMEDLPPEHIEGFETGKHVDLLVGGSLSYLNWLAKSEVTQDGIDDSLMSVDYDISSTTYRGAFLQGRIFNTQLAIAYLQNEAQEKGGLTKQASQLINATFDINGLFSKRSTLRLATEQADVNGIATVDNSSLSTQEFKSKLRKYSALVMGERGIYAGLQYMQYQMPTAVGFSDESKDVVLSIYDPKFKTKQFGIVFGYDELHYAKRYENNLNRFYWSMAVSLGLGSAGLSTEVKDQAESGGDKLLYPLTANVGVNLDLGFIHQARFKAIRGAGYTVSAGYRANFAVFGAGQVKDSEEKIDPGELELETQKLDFWHGPFVTLSLIY